MAHAAMECVARAEQVRSLSEIDRVVAQSKDRATHDHAKPTVPGERRDDVIGNAVGEIFLSWLVTDDAEGQHRDRWPRLGCADALVLVIRFRDRAREAISNARHC